MMSVNACDSDPKQSPGGAIGRVPWRVPGRVLGGFLRRAAIAPVRFLQAMMRGIAERRVLDALSHHSLQDIGLTRFEVDYEMRKAFRRD